MSCHHSRFAARPCPPSHCLSHYRLAICLVIACCSKTSDLRTLSVSADDRRGSLAARLHLHAGSYRSPSYQRGLSSKHSLIFHQYFYLELLLTQPFSGRSLLVTPSAMDEHSCSELLRTADCMLRRRTEEMYLYFERSCALQGLRRVLLGPSDVCW